MNIRGLPVVLRRDTTWPGARRAVSQTGGGTPPRDNLGCEPGAAAPIVTPFNGEQNAGIQVVNTAQFPVNAGPLSRVHR